MLGLRRKRKKRHYKKLGTQSRGHKGHWLCRGSVFVRLGKMQTRHPYFRDIDWGVNDTAGEHWLPAFIVSYLLPEFLLRDHLRELSARWTLALQYPEGTLGLGVSD